jgi:hypothetical protein
MKTKDRETSILEVLVAIYSTVIPAQAGIHAFFWIPGRASLARNDDFSADSVR